MVHFQVKPSIDVNHPSDTGNTALHAAANNGNVKLVTELLKSRDINVNCLNPQCDNAAPLHLAVMHGRYTYPSLSVTIHTCICINCNFT